MVTSAPHVRLLTETLINFTQAGQGLPGRGGLRATNPSTVFRWARTGVRGPGGARVRLEAVRVGSRWLTSREAVARFVDALTAAPQPATGESPMDADRATRAAIETLKAMKG